MTKKDLIDLAGMGNETIDFALPQGFIDECNKLGIKASQEYVWHYSEGSNSGVPLSIGEIAVKAIQRGGLIPFTVIAAVERAQSHNNSLDSKSIAELTRLSNRE